ncbi:Formyl transferase [Cohaesibacter gelatinilyticus]|uniref:Formyl transferase n=2 Tax=Cohaesibacter gelatinilyticus TaxID=372072 RepID=A0A285NDY2_9HYPH|nr:Formyl transferase [Cohaesibacter gelatinilyticus]
MPELEAKFFRDQINILAPDLQILSANSDTELEKAVAHSQYPCHLFGFMTPVYVPSRHLSQLAKAYNLHPGPPSRPGFRPTHFAILERDREFGVTLHEMAPQIDAGTIVTTRYFGIEDLDTIPALEERAYVEALSLVQDYLPVILGMKEPAPYLGKDWSGAKMRSQDLQELEVRQKENPPK